MIYKGFYIDEYGVYTIEMKLVHDQEEITKEDAQFSFGKITYFIEHKK